MSGKFYYLSKYIVLSFLFSILLLSGCGEKLSSNELFTDDVYKNLVEINYWLGDTKLVIDKEEDMKEIYKNLSSLKLKNVPSFESQKVGHLHIDLVTVDKTISIGLLSGEITTNGERYSTNKDIVDLIRNIALKYEEQ
ncbi:MAG: hypothetical protein K0R71_537 [Bacillales bacterium]|jgi:hypothetical protein|nr:hypothetical protein [Bacillales bacterium]